MDINGIFATKRENETYTLRFDGPSVPEDEDEDDGRGNNNDDDDRDEDRDPPRRPTHDPRAPTGAPTRG